MCKCWHAPEVLNHAEGLNKNDTQTVDQRGTPYVWKILTDGIMANIFLFLVIPKGTTPVLLLFCTLFSTTWHHFHRMPLIPMKKNEINENGKERRKKGIL